MSKKLELKPLNKDWILQTINQCLEKASDDMQRTIDWSIQVMYAPLSYTGLSSKEIKIVEDAKAKIDRFLAADEKVRLDSIISILQGGDYYD